MPAVALSDALRDRAREDPERAAITDGRRTLSRARVDELVDLCALRLLEAEVGPGAVVALSATNSAELLMAIFAVWRVGAVPLALHPRKQRDEMIDLVARSGAELAVGFPAGYRADWSGVRTCSLDDLFRPGASGPLPEVPVSPRLRIGSSGGSTGPAKLIAVDVPAIVNPARPWHYGLRPGGTHVVPLDVCDGTGFVASTAALALGCHQVLMHRFDAETMLGLVERFRVDWTAMTQPSMVATVKLPAQVRTGYDVSSLRCVTQYSGAVAEWVKRAWIEWLGPERIAESYGASDARGSTWIDGAEWLARPGSVGRAAPGCEIAIFSAAGRRLPAGEPGLVYIRDLTGRRNFHYLQGAPESLDGGWENFGDSGRLDGDGYLYLLDRTKDIIGAAEGPVIPLPVEGALEFHHAVRSAVVIGLPGRDGVERVHALIDAPGGVDVTDLECMLRERFPGVRVPDTWEQVDGPLRDNAGKASRRRLRDQRVPPA
ncbi:AMP-binding protein [uncultured Jatrophihabitans sp.]|uniref:AMP-binding protein n=1 Tax=uncultured Jatrophihabitans sp. TaxID=1610747 RepID=UPI0035CC7DEC